MDKKQLLLKIKANPTQYVDLLLEGYNSGVLDFDQHFDLLMMCNKKWSVQKPIQDMLPKVPVIPLSDEDAALVAELRALILMANKED